MKRCCGEKCGSQGATTEAEQVHLVARLVDSAGRGVSRGRLCTHAERKEAHSMRYWYPSRTCSPRFLRNSVKKSRSDPPPRSKGWAGQHAPGDHVVDLAADGLDYPTRSPSRLVPILNRRGQHPPRPPSGVGHTHVPMPVCRRRRRQIGSDLRS